VISHGEADTGSPLTHDVRELNFIGSPPYKGLEQVVLSAERQVLSQKPLSYRSSHTGCKGKAMYLPLGQKGGSWSLLMRGGLSPLSLRTQTWMSLCTAVAKPWLQVERMDTALLPSLWALCAGFSSWTEEPASPGLRSTQNHPPTMHLIILTIHGLLAFPGISPKM
jgi:hypothetical protein